MPSNPPLSQYLQLFAEGRSTRSLLRLGLLLLIISQSTAAQPLSDTDPRSDLLRVEAAVKQLVRTQLPSGLFPYDYNFKNGAVTGMDTIDGINLVRQTGAIFAVSEYVATYGNTSSIPVLIKFLEKVQAESLPISKGFIQRRLEQFGLYNRWQLWQSWRAPLYRLGLLFETEGEAKLVALYQDYELAWPGATALSLITALRYRAVTGDRRFDPIVHAWKDGLLALWVPGRGLREAPHYLSESPYVNGEAWLALAEYVRIFPEEDSVRNMLVEFEEYLFNRYSEHNSRFYHWGSMAAAVRAVTSNERKYTDFLYRLSLNYMNEDGSKAPRRGNSCASLEGLTTFIGTMQQLDRGQDPLVSRTREFVSRAMVNNRALQIDEDFIANRADQAHHREALNRHRGAFVESPEQPLMQVDYTGHCINAMLRLIALDTTEQQGLSGNGVP